MISEIKRPQPLTGLTAPEEISWTGERALPPVNESLAENIGEQSETALSEMLQSPDATATVPETSPPEALPAAEAADEQGQTPEESAPAEEASAEAPALPAVSTPEVIDEAIKTEDDKTLMAAMEENPDAVADRLNAIEPSALSSEDLRDTPPATEEKTTAETSESGKEAQHDMGSIYIAGHESVKRDLKRAHFWFEQAANNGVANAKYNLGVLYHQGMGVEASLDKALSLYSEAAEQGHPEAEYNLGIAYIGGIGYPYDPVKAANYFENAANKGVKEAAYNLGLIYENGLLGKPQPDEALMWYKDAAEKGSPEANTGTSRARGK